MIDSKDKSVVKWKSSLRKHMINVLALLENHEQPQMEIKLQLIKANVCFNNWHSDVAEFSVAKASSAKMFNPDQINIF